MADVHRATGMAVQWIVLSVLSLQLIYSVQGVQQITNPRIVEHPEDQYVAKNEPATLNCKAEGDPPPIITWYRNGTPVITADENPQSHRMLLPSGQLFFLRIIHNKSAKPDVGVYYCNATNPETRVSVVSRNATLEIAVLRDDFQEHPRNTEVAVGDTGVLQCNPPKGLPEPKVKWQKDSEAVRISGHYKLEGSGNLVIQDARHTDSGIYVCIAENKAGERESSPARLLVREKPHITKTPQEVTVEEGLNIQFQCQAEGDPPPTIVWKREDGQVSGARSEILPDRSLKISKVQVSDEGVYICRAENSVGFVEANARLTVHSEPTFLVTPRDKVVGVGRRVSFRCEVIGNPPPALFWSKETNHQGNEVLMFPRQDVGRFSVTDDGTLVIESVRLEDEGEYMCQAISVAGSAFAKATLQVKDVDPRPPPIIHQGPQNQTLPVNSVAMLQCSASGDPPPTIRWYKDRHVITHRDPRFALLDSGTLQISDLRRGDTGIYVCKAMSETGETSWGAALIVEAPTNPHVIFHRTPEPSTFPGPPSPPSIADVTDTTMRLSWKSSTNHGASPVFAYTVEYFSHETGEGWVVASDSITEQVLTVRGLLPDTPYMFLVRAQNSHGLSQPSQVTAPMRTTGQSRNIRPVLPELDIALVTEKLTGNIVNMLQPKVISSTAIQLNWEIRKSHRYIEGYHIKYRVFPSLKEHLSHSQQHHHHHVDFTIETVTTGSATTYMLRNLEKYTWYEIRIQPFYMTIEGQESNTVRVRTFDDRPDKPPIDIMAPMLDNTTLRLSWKPPPEEAKNGVLNGYKIFLYGNESKYNREIRVNDTVNAIIINHLVHGMTYRIQLLAHTKIGDGPPSDPIIVGADPKLNLTRTIVKEPWFIATLIGTIGCTLWFALCVFSIWLYRKKHAKKKMGKHCNSTMNSHKSDDARTRAGDTANPAPPLRTPNDAPPPIPSGSHSNKMFMAPCCTDNESFDHLDLQGSRLSGNASYHSYQQLDAMAPDVTNVGNDCKQETENLYNLPNVPQPPMKTFYNKNNSVAQPYATTTLIANNLGSPPNGDSAFRPIQQGYVQHPQNSSSSGDSCQKPNLSTDSNTDNNRSVNGVCMHHGNPDYHPEYSGYMADLPPENCMQCQMGGCDCGQMTADEDGYDQVPGMLQPILFLPPPPEHPPPSDIGTPPDSPGNQRRGPPSCHYSDQGSMAGYYHIGGRLPQCHNGMHTPVSDGGVYSRAMYSDSEHHGVSPRDSLQNGDCCNHHGNPRPTNPQYPRPNSPKYRTMSPHLRQDYRAYSPHAMSEPERGPTPPVRGYKLVPIHDTEMAKHYSDHEGVPHPPLRMSHHTPPSPAPEDPMMDRAIQSSLPSLANGVEQEEYCPESDMEVGGRDCPSPRSDVDVDVDTVTGSMMASWASVTDNSDNGSSMRSSAASSSDGSFFAEADFASAVAKAAELSGLTVVGSTVMDPNAGREKIKKPAKHRQRAKRPTSPYSTDSNYSSVQLPHKPYPKSQRKKQLQELGRKPPPIKAKPMMNSQGFDVPSYSRPNFPGTLSSIKTSPDSEQHDTMNVRTNPMAAFDTRDTSIV